MSFSENVKEEILKSKVWDNNSLYTQDEQIKRVSIRESFLKSGSITNPNKDYHLEISFKTKKKAEELIKDLDAFNKINAKIIKRNSRFVVYIKDGEDISNFLALIGVNNAVIRFEEIRVIKETRNSINRQVNCETANLNRIIDTSVEQIENIHTIKKANKFNCLSKELKELANLRLENPDASMKELGEMLTDKISKSGVNHRFIKIKEIAEELIRK